MQQDDLSSDQPGGGTTVQHVTPADEHIDYSVIIPTYNGRRTIAACLASVEAALAGYKAEVIVVDSSTDDTAAVVRERFPAVILIRSRVRLSAGGARNRGVSAARGRLLFFTDQDCIVPPDWIGRLAAHFEDGQVDGVGGSIAIHNPESASGNALYFLEFLNHFPGRRAARPNDGFLVGCNAAYRAEVLRAVAFPDMTLGEDVLFGHSLNKHGWRTVYDERIEVRHDNRTGWKTFFQYNYKMGRAAATYHSVLKLGWARPFLRFPELAVMAPGVVLPSIAIDLLLSRPRYLLRYLPLLPMCLLGNLWWASGFRAEGRALRRQRHATVRQHAPGMDSRPAASPAANDSRPRARDGRALSRY